MEYSPVILFVYNRPRHTRRTIKALVKNHGSDKTDLIVFSDAAKSEKDNNAVESVRKLLKKISGFKSVSVVLRPCNYACRRNMVEGITLVSKKYSQFIVMEDDTLPGPYFLDFMNKALKIYKDNKKVWHIAGWNYPIKTSDMADTFLCQLMNCWGWATWSDRWSNFQMDPDKLISEFSNDDIDKFDLNIPSGGFWGQVLAHKAGTLPEAWDIYWYATIFRRNGLCLSPSKSLVKSIGNDGSGFNHSDVSIYNIPLPKHRVTNFEVNDYSNKEGLSRVRQFIQVNKKKPFFIKKITRKLILYTIRRPIRRILDAI